MNMWSTTATLVLIIFPLASRGQNNDNPLNEKYGVEFQPESGNEADAYSQGQPLWPQEQPLLLPPNQPQWQSPQQPQWGPQWSPNDQPPWQDQPLWDPQQPQEPQWQPQQPQEPQWQPQQPQEPQWQPQEPQWQPQGPQWQPQGPQWQPQGPQWEPHEPQWQPQEPQWQPQGQSQLLPRDQPQEQPQWFSPQVQPQFSPGQEQPQFYPGQEQPQFYPGQEQPQFYPGQEQPQFYPGQEQPQFYPGQEQPQFYPGQEQPQFYPGQMYPQVSQPKSENQWYIPPGSVPAEFASEIANDPQIQAPVAQPNTNTIQQQPSWANYDFAQTGCYYDHYCPQPQYVDGTWHDYNSFYYGTCPNQWEVWNNGCEGAAEEVPFCDPNYCTQSCIQHLNYGKGVCIDQECYCSKSDTIDVKPEPEPDWTYDDQKDWPKKYPNCSKSPQSPVLLTDKLMRSLNRKIQFLNYDKPNELIVSNTGHGIRIYVQSKGANVPSVSLVGLTNENTDWSGNFYLGHIDLHWGSSEHSITGEMADFEMQLYHFDPSFDSYEEASKSPGATKTLAFLFKIHTNETDLCHKISMAVKKIVEPGSEAKIGMGQHLNFVNKKITSQNFYVYHGSQTQPHCYQTHWLVSDTILKITEAQLKALQSILDVENKPITSNIRDIQAMRSSS